MKINELILELQKKAEEYGNVEVFCQSDIISPVLEITPIGHWDLDDKGNEGFILLSFDKLENITDDPIEYLDDEEDENWFDENDPKELLI